MDVWYHGSQEVLATLRAGSTITRRRRLAEAFSHRPSVLGIDDDGSIRHNGTVAGWLHVVDESVSADDIYPHPHSTLEPGEEWLTRRDLPLRLIGPVPLTPEERLSEAELRALKQAVERG